MKCAVGNCKQSSSRKTATGKSVSFYSFPKDPALKKLWVKFCNRAKAINVQYERICGEHFKEEDFERNLKFELGYSKRRCRKLKPGTIPTIRSNGAAISVKTVKCNNNNAESNPQPHMDISNAKTQEERNLKKPPADGRTQTSTLYLLPMLTFLNRADNASSSKNIYLGVKNSYDKQKILSSNSKTDIACPIENVLNSPEPALQEADNSNQMPLKLDIKVEETEINTDSDSLSQVVHDQTLSKIEYQTEYIDIKPEFNQESDSVSDCNQEAYSMESEQAILDDLVRLPVENYKHNQNTCQSLCSLWSQKLTNMDNSQRDFAENLITEVLSNGELGLLSFNTSLQNLKQYQSAFTVKKENLE